MERIKIGPSLLKQRVTLIVIALCFLSILTWQTDVLVWQLTICVLLLFLLAAYFIAVERKDNMLEHVELSSTGRWRYLSEAQSHQHWSIHHHSRITDWVLWLELRDYLSKQSVRALIWRDSVSEPHYRAICRAVKRAQLQTLVNIDA